MTKPHVTPSTQPEGLTHPWKGFCHRTFRNEWKCTPGTLNTVVFPPIYTCMLKQTRWLSKLYVGVVWWYILSSKSSDQWNDVFLTSSLWAGESCDAVSLCNSTVTSNGSMIERAVSVSQLRQHENISVFCEYMTIYTNYFYLVISLRELCAKFEWENNSCFSCNLFKSYY